MINLPSLYEMALMLPGIILGLTFHELAHGWVADRLGDTTARYQGRLTLNPLVHVDVIGLIMLFIAGFGWAKPVPVNPYNFRGDMRRGLMLVSLAGPATNMLLAVAGAVALGLGAWKLPYGQEIVINIIHINVILAVFNLLPIPPLDGSKILAGVLPGRQPWLYMLENYGIIILLLLLFTGIIGKVLRWIIVPLYEVLLGLAKAIALLVA
ncbi:site-2 protease family protein [Desulfofundulus thermocisternus]|uniref:site-2 protease family protein n=1 Tax=Desulfofundulus thermocisternus TaxID=42471 RepID=UPI00217EAB60|nr:site-2 protease family protein [Desulfofundulus thermocisternus]MCS5696576.1 site-2 protease family protein [Desulfofundulus thermocisternus]